MRPHAIPAREMRGGAALDVGGVARRRRVGAIVADEAEHAAQPRLLRRRRDRRDVALRARAGVDHSGEPAAQGFERRGFGGEVDELLVERALERDPDAAEDFRRLAENRAPFRRSA